MKRLFFSIVIPAHNESASIGQTVRAVLRQSYRDFEVIVVDNLSTDDTVAQVQALAAADTRVRVISCPTKGILYARDAGYRAAQGDIIVQLDANAFPRSTTWLTRAAHYFENQSVVAIAGPYDLYDARWTFRWGALLSIRIGFPLLNWFVQKTHRGGFFIGGNAFVRKSALDAIGGYPVTKTEFWFEDIITACAIAKHGWIATKYDLVVAKSARRYIQHGYRRTQREYNKGTLAVLLRRPFPEMSKASDTR